MGVTATIDPVGRPFRVASPYSDLSEAMGSIRAARRAGT